MHSSAYCELELGDAGSNLESKINIAKNAKYTPKMKQHYLCLQEIWSYKRGSLEHVTHPKFTKAVELVEIAKSTNACPNQFTKLHNLSLQVFKSSRLGILSAVLGTFFLTTFPFC